MTMATSGFKGLRVNMDQPQMEVSSRVISCLLVKQGHTRDIVQYDSQLTNVTIYTSAYNTLDYVLLPPIDGG